jgi:ATP-binding cassette subfamily F protein 3
VNVYPGNYEDYLRRKQGLADPLAGLSAPYESVVVAPVQELPKTSPEGNGGRLRRLNPIKLRQMQDRCTFVEEEIPRVEASIAGAERALGQYVSAEETQRLAQSLDDLRARHATLSDEWEALVVELEQQEPAT